MTNNTMNLGEPPRIIKEKVLAIRGQWIVKGRIVVYHNHIRRVELMLVEDKNLQAQEVGFSLDELQQLQQLLVSYIDSEKEVVIPPVQYFYDNR
jgi:hypothetical protein